MDLLKNIRLADLKERGATLIRDYDIGKDSCSGTIYYYYDKYDEEQSSADVTVRYFPRGGAEITGPHPDSSEGYDKLLKYLEKLHEEGDIKEKILKRKMIAFAFIGIQVLLTVLIGKSLIDALMTGDIEIWEKLIIEMILLVLVNYESLKSLRL